MRRFAVPVTTGYNPCGGPYMTDLLEKAFEHASKLPPQQQDALAKWLLDEIEADRAWDATFAKSPAWLASLAAEALHEKNAGDAHPLVPDEL